MATGQGVVGLYVNDAAKAVSEVAPGVNEVVGLYQGCNSIDIFWPRIRSKVMFEFSDMSKLGVSYPVRPKK